LFRGSFLAQQVYNVPGRNARHNHKARFGFGAVNRAMPTLNVNGRMTTSGHTGLSIFEHRSGVGGVGVGVGGGTTVAENLVGQLVVKNPNKTE
jgi:hypothetical protein